MAKGSAKKIALGAMLAAAIGYVAGLLTAPKSGKATRADLKKEASKDVAAAETQLKKARAELDKTVSTAKVQANKLKGEANQEIKKLLAQAETAKTKAAEITKAVKEGEADDRDLQEAIHSVTDAFEHLKTYLKKI